VAPKPNLSQLRAERANATFFLPSLRERGSGRRGRQALRQINFFRVPLYSQAFLLIACVTFALWQLINCADSLAPPKMGPISARSLAANSPEISALMSLLEKQLRLKQYQTARETTEKLQGLLKPDDARFLEVASLLAVHEQYSTAIPLLEQARKVSPASYDVDYNLALAYFRNGNHSKSAETLQALLAHQPRAEAYNLLAQVEEQRKRFLEAVRAFQKAAELEPGNEDYRFDYGYELLQHKTTPAAIAVFSSGVHDFPRSVKMGLGLGCAYYLIAKFEEAAQTLLKVLSMNPKLPVAYFLLGKIYESVGPSQTAIAEALSRYLENNPDDPWAYLHQGAILYQQGQLDPKPDFRLAKDKIERAIQLRDNFPEAYLQLALILQSEGETEQSVAILDRAIHLNPKLAAAHYRLGMAYKRLGQRDKAKSEFALSEKLNAAGQAEFERRQVIQFLTEQRF
jgi:tetratricopeptide (TPR) repeat protein